MSVTWIEEQKHLLPQRNEQLNLADEVELFYATAKTNYLNGVSQMKQQKSVMLYLF